MPTNRLSLRLLLYMYSVPLPHIQHLPLVGIYQSTILSKYNMYMLVNQTILVS